MCTASERAALGLLSLWPLFDVAALSYFAAAGFGPVLGSGIVVLLPLQGLALVVWGGVLAFDLRHLIRSRGLTRRVRWGWGAGLVLAGPLVMPLYWARHVSTTPVLSRAPVAA